MSATLNAELFSSYFGGAPTIHIPVSYCVFVPKSLKYCINCSFPSFINFDEAVLIFHYFVFSNANSGIHTSSESTFSGRYIGEVRLQVDLKQST